MIVLLLIHLFDSINKRGLLNWFPHLQQAMSVLLDDEFKHIKLVRVMKENKYFNLHIFNKPWQSYSIMTFKYIAHMTENKMHQ